MVFSLCEEHEPRASLELKTCAHAATLGNRQWPIDRIDNPCRRSSFLRECDFTGAFSWECRR